MPTCEDVTDILALLAQLFCTSDAITLAALYIAVEMQLRKRVVT
jgi:hypothetical protein